MKKFYYILAVLFTIIACSKKNDAIKEDILVTKDSLNSVTENEAESDCIFDNKPKELTEEWLKEAGFDNFVWDSKNNHAIVFLEKDTLFVYKGGCNHLTTSVDIRIQNQYNDMFDHRILKKIDSIACKFKFDNYCGKIASNKFDKMEAEGDSFLLEFEDDDPDDNLILEGIQVVKVKNSLHFKISEYYN